MRIGILTSGGDCPGLNAVIRGAVIKGDRIHGQTFLGIKDGWRGLIEDDIIPLPRHDVRGLSRQGGTILGTSRTNPFDDGGVERIREVMAHHQMDAVIAIGGEGTLTAARRLTDEGIRIVGVPKTIDNDLSATDYTFGFDTAVAIATESIDRLRTTAESHHRCMVVEVMGRHVGWIALHAGLAAGAHAILIPEVPQSLSQITEWVEGAKSRNRAPVIVVAEGFTMDGEEHVVAPRGLDAFGRPRLGGIGERLGPMIEDATGIETRTATLGHLQRGGVPSAYDRVLATRFGTGAIDAVVDGRWGTMVSLNGIDIETVDLHDATTVLKTVPQARYDEAAILFG
ncbi:ATP-dependent 6-phosphofructokinase [Luteipulveratus mongoliensis]|uniref:ATP-dependent 6-phosphofructokinase n=1 Tax=Luteipulveratus mongoliensis TaxID=571913 RepID=A0A0K1JEM7_9MICO|nr:ATP-dependent 6-phosphofructokinase [Luteipulveratus mongoliensis]AKU15167.1 6-phosphofructokinase [Luteipulveratus mongoliensis]